ncbi:TetR/AcrR family transcriptional regulator [Saccharibacillus sp. CPCC 101409]|uniref:TetR/AcrR family transcriptional regulator n=1 Tax=Saccharibacillus sp. CPCC 101409 TaxID=3058041 RepID=UPI0026721F54|nr:TetR/AcrR family transcriptional regulator [Saccharibacillus sp. CPCC 101409]MDO3408911.1 TetR/AcrR family transcriptional regulator [Saccharibacillus sp. CPCC 101409]
MKQEERRQHSTALLLDTVKQLVREKGCAAVTMKDIMEQSGLSKGAIFHYVKSKDELFVQVLQERLEDTNVRFRNEVQQSGTSFAEPMRRISDSIASYADAEDVTNRILLYLLGREDQPVAAQALKEYYERTLELSAEWIRIGQRHGAIAETVDAARTADMFVLLTMGLRVRSSIPGTTERFSASHFSEWIAQMLQPQGRNDSVKE